MSVGPEECRKNAEECLRLAAEASTPDAKQHFRELAQRWLALAADEEASWTAFEKDQGNLSRSRRT